MRLSMKTRKELTDVRASAYRASSYQDKKRLLDVFVEETGYSRKYASHLLSRWGLSQIVQLEGHLIELKAGRRKQAKRQGCKKYDIRVDSALEELRRAFNGLCSKRLAVAIQNELPTIGPVLHIPEDLWPALRAMSPATMDRHLAAARKRDPLHGLCLTKPAKGLKNLIPVRTAFNWSELPPGYCQADTVGHEGGKSYGDFCCSLDVVDVATGWVELQALLNKARRWMQEGLRDVRGRLPFALLGIHTDSGGEFINKTVWEFCIEAGIEFTRSRPNRKNDNCYVEGKNNVTVRETVGYDRYEGEAAKDALNEVYRRLCPLMNHFFPSMRLIEKKRVGSKVTKVYDKPKTPYQRLLDDPRVTEEVKDRLRSQHASLDMLQLRQELLDALEHLFTLATKWPCKEARADARASAGS
jgi:hypothetical protein